MEINPIPSRWSQDGRHSHFWCAQIFVLEASAGGQGGRPVCPGLVKSTLRNLQRALLRVTLGSVDS